MTIESMIGDTVAIERQDEAGTDQYLLRRIVETPTGELRLRANNGDYEDMTVSDTFRVFARLIQTLSPFDMALHRSFRREGIPVLFGEIFKKGSWGSSGHISIDGGGTQVLLVTLNKANKATEHRYHDYFEDAHVFHWQSQNSTSPTNKKGLSIIQHTEKGIKIHLFVRKNKLGVDKKAASFSYCGELLYVNHSGSKPMNVQFELKKSLSSALQEMFID